jgi:hypothetical protein
LEKEEVIMRRLGGFFFGMILLLSFCFVLPGLTQETREREGVYTIKKGDTLWDISSKFLKDPFLWPKLWERNPYITNPHWIYPGNPIRLTAIEPVQKEEPTKEERKKGEPKKVAEEKAQEEKPQEGVKKPEAGKVEPTPPVEKKPETVAEEKPAPVEVKPAPEEEKSVPEEKPVKAEEKRVYFREIRSAGFMSDVEYRGVGIVLESREGKNLMSGGDIIFLAFRTSEPILIGDRYTVFRAAEEIKHPITERRIGRKYNIIGNIQLIDQNGSFFTAKVIESFDGIMKGDFIQPYSKEKMEGVIER